MEDEQDDLRSILSVKLYVAPAFIGIGLWISLIFTHPVIWAVGTGIVMLFLFGIMTAKFLFQVHEFWKVMTLAPIFGSFWLGFFWIVFRVFGDN